jgi:hypothetical protein
VVWALQCAKFSNLVWGFPARAPQSCPSCGHAAPATLLQAGEAAGDDAEEGGEAEEEAAAVAEGEEGADSSEGGVLKVRLCLLAIAA